MPPYYSLKPLIAMPLISRLEIAETFEGLTHNTVAVLYLKEVTYCSLYYEARILTYYLQALESHCFT